MFLIKVKIAPTAWCQSPMYEKKSYYLYVSIFLHVPIFSPFQLGQKMEKKKQSLEKCSDLNCDEDCQSWKWCGSNLCIDVKEQTWPFCRIMTSNCHWWYHGVKSSITSCTAASPNIDLSDFRLSLNLEFEAFSIETEGFLKTQFWYYFMAVNSLTKYIHSWFQKIKVKADAE